MRPLMIVSVTAALVIAAAAAPTDAYAAPHPSHIRTGCDTGASDFDGNGGADLAVTGPDIGGDEDSGWEGGAVEVLMRHKHGMRKHWVPRPRRFENQPVHNFAMAITELDLSSHKDASQPCADFAVSAYYGHGAHSKSVIFLYRWLKKAH